MPSLTLPPRPPLRALRRWRRRPSLYWLAAALLAVLTGTTVARLTGDAEAQAARWGNLRPTLVATTDLGAGATMGPDDAEVRLLPAALVPAGALTEPALGAVVAAPVHPGEAVLSARLAPAGRSPTAALLPQGTRGVAVPAGTATLPLQPGDVVDVLATFDPTVVPSADPTVIVSRGAVVVDVAVEAATVAVAEAAAPRVAYALAAGAVTLALSPGPAPASLSG